MNDSFYNELGIYIIYCGTRIEHKNEQDLFKNSSVESDTSMKPMILLTATVNIFVMIITIC